MIFRLALLTAASLAFLLPAAAAPPGLPPQPKVHPAGIPADAVLVSPCVRGMGEHWANLKNLPLGPIYGTYRGKPVFSEIMIDKKAFAAGRSYLNLLRPLPGYTIDHVDVEFVPYGHAGYPIPHYDLHAYYVPHAVHEAFCPNGERQLTAPPQVP
ncbi:MAG TPA: hypothetical protein VFA29_02800 [Candidatus Baltobacteraceae bacterium]|nr:hypothetical protein [Candidatus Baltobacteraceae bacterium]